MRREAVPLAVVAAVRPGAGEPLPATGVIHVGVLGRDAVAELVGPARVDELYERSKGHPLFLTELAQQAAGRDAARVAGRVGVRALRRAGHRPARCCGPRR